METETEMLLLSVSAKLILQTSISIHLHQTKYANLHFPSVFICKVLTLHGLLTHNTCHVQVRATGAIWLYIQLIPWQYRIYHYNAGVWSSYRDKHYNWFWE